ncbi:hypothetical protein [Chryseobacterium indologenes]|uniref:hypothetical protein n=1 Tax=Chryseobacterium indologenes TaxID=253 RepID=UPI003D34970E
MSHKIFSITKNVIVDGGEVVNFENDNTFGDFSTSNIQFKNVEWKGGTIENLSHTLFQSCVFTGNYVFSSADQVSFANNIKYASVQGCLLILSIV